MKITDILNETVVRTNFPATSKEQIIDGLIDLVASSPNVLNIEKVRNAIWDREKIMSTGVGNAFAIPHGKTDGVSNITAAFAITSEPVEYQSLDAQPVQLAFLLVGREDMVGPHIKLLSRISRLMNQEEFREKLLRATTTKEILEDFREAEALYLDGK
ncbi:MAG: PTS sugar transporter subunit IIA [Ignavibacteriales bacterium]|nr:PTS sugar transporter subunit IIA [Ignavibacteriales bacterium]